MLGNMKLLGLVDLVNSLQSQRSERPQGSITCLTWEEPDRIPGNAFLKVAEGFFSEEKRNYQNVSCNHNWRKKPHGLM